MNLLELRNGIVHADHPDGIDYTLCGCDAEIIVNSRAEYHPEDETETEPHMMPTRLKVTCPRCARIIRVHTWHGVHRGRNCRTTHHQGDNQ